jgi:hypothetical protein
MLDMQYTKADPKRTDIFGFGLTIYMIQKVLYQLQLGSKANLIIQTETLHTPSSITHCSNGLVSSNVHFASVVAQPGSEVYLATVRLEKKDNKPLLLELPPEIIPIVHKEFSDVFPTSLPAGLPPDQGDTMKIDTDPSADPPV